MRAAGRYFQDHYADVSLGWGLVERGTLRRAQLGAAWAISAHSTTSGEPALVVLPTGVGKTLVLCLAPFLLRARRVLVVTPGKLVRSQVASAFATLRDLKGVGVLPADLAGPRVAIADRRATSADWIEWSHADVVVGTPNVLSDGFPEVQRLPRDLFDLVVFDEAHHLPARVWTAILDATDGRAVLLTATPTRQDGKPLPGDLVYSYPLSQAIADGVYAPVRFVPVECGEGQDPDEVLARAAIGRLGDPVHAEAGSRLLVRTGTQAEARALVDLYRQAGAKLGLVLADTSPRTLETILRQVREGELQGFVAVGALIEGFDFPSLKVAAYHRPHRSLAPTLQFVGRLSRAQPSGVRGELLAIPSEVAGETRDLYQQERDWAELMPEIVEAAELEERAVRHYVARAAVAGPLELPPRALRPPRSARIYRVPDEVPVGLDVSPESIGRGRVVFRFYDAETDLLALVTHQAVTQRWAATRVLEVSEFGLHVATWLSERRILFVSTESEPALRDLLDAFGVRTAARGVDPLDLVRLVHAANPRSYFSVGLRAAAPRRAQGASYDLTSGPSVETALSYAERNSGFLGHLMARPATGNRGTIGFSVAKSKLWEPDNAGSLLEFRRWAEERGEELDRPAPTQALPGLDVRISSTFAAFPAEVIGIALDVSFVLGDMVLVRGTSALAPAELDVLGRLDGEALEITIAHGDSPLWRGQLNSQGTVVELENDGIEVLAAETGEVIGVDLAFHFAPLSIHLADGSTVVGDQILPAADTIGPLPAAIAESCDWSGVDIRRELGPEGSVHSRTAEYAAQDAIWLAADHGVGEIADFVAMARNGQQRCLTLFHCKGAGGPEPGHRVDDLYEVLGQVAKSVPWTLSGQVLAAELLRRLDTRDAFRVLQGDPQQVREDLEALLGGQDEILVEVLAVQPGVSVANLADWPRGRALLHSTSIWCSSAGTDSRLLGSA